MAAIIDFLILIRYSQKWQRMGIHNAQLMLQGITLSLSVFKKNKLNLTGIEQKLLPCATYFSGTAMFTQAAKKQITNSISVGRGGGGVAVADPELQLC